MNSPDFRGGSFLNRYDNALAQSVNYNNRTGTFIDNP
jgi:hypothetical protein